MTGRQKTAIAVAAGVLLLAVIVYIGFTQFNKPVEPAEPVAEASVSTEAKEPAKERNLLSKNRRSQKPKNLSRTKWPLQISLMRNLNMTTETWVNSEIC